jgi:hypothetical protein
MATKKSELQFPKPKRSVIQWLLDSDPSIRRQVMRDLTEDTDEHTPASSGSISHVTLLGCSCAISGL